MEISADRVKNGQVPHIVKE